MYVSLAVRDSLGNVLTKGREHFAFGSECAKEVLDGGMLWLREAHSRRAESSVVCRHHS